MKVLSTSIAASALTMALSLPAAAATMKAVVTGTVTNGYDQIGAFGADTDLLGKEVTVTYIYDPALAGYRNDSSPNYDEAVGGTVYGNSSPALSTTVQVGAVSREFIIGYYDTFVAADYQHTTYYDQWYAYTIGYEVDQDSGASRTDYASANIFYYFDDQITGDLEAPFDFLVDTNTHYFNGFFSTGFSNQEYCYGNGDDGGDYIESYDYFDGCASASGYFSIDRIAVSYADDVDPVAPVPLPASALLLLGALGGIAALRRRRV
jgi:hypothetical protein